MIITPLGKSEIFINEVEKAFEVKQLARSGKNFIVDERKQVWLKDLGEGMVIECVLDVENKIKPRTIIESGEDLALISFYSDNTKLSVGVMGDRKGIKYEYLENGIRIKVLENQVDNSMLVNIAWLHMTNPSEEDIYCWFAADPIIS